MLLFKGAYLPAEWGQLTEAWRLPEPQSVSSLQFGTNEEAQWRQQVEAERGSRNYAFALEVKKKRMKKKLSPHPSIDRPSSPSRQHLSDWSSGPKHFTIFSKNCWTVENHLIRETTLFLLPFRKVAPLLWWIRLVREKERLEISRGHRHHSVMDKPSRSCEEPGGQVRVAYLGEICASLVSSLPRMPICNVWSSLYTRFVGLGSNKPLIQAGMRLILV